MKPDLSQIKKLAEAATRQVEPGYVDCAHVSRFERAITPLAVLWMVERIEELEREREALHHQLDIYGQARTESLGTGEVTLPLMHRILNLAADRKALSQGPTR